MVSSIMKVLWGALRYGGYVLALPGNILWHYGYCRYNGYVGGRVEIVGANPPVATPPTAPTAPVTASISAVIPATPA